ncbi:hypothetical protein KY310_03980 [Candidatus Woesearchaeota archaeon]|nr:hypothetical protein [Candidatus Woesearchaeota archaeon]
MPNEQAQLLSIISEANQNIWEEIISIIASTEGYLEDKYRLTINELEEAQIYQDPKAGEILIRGALRIPAGTTDFAVIDFLKKARALHGSIANLGKAVSKLPASIVDVLNTAAAARAQAHFLLKTVQNHLTQFKERKIIEAGLLRIITDLGTIQQYGQKLMEMAYTKRAAA